MAKLHAKCVYCGGSVYRIGGRRRRCVLCGRTWSVRRKKRGRKRHRFAMALIESAIVDHCSARVLSRRYHRSPTTMRHRVACAIRQLAQQPGAAKLPAGDLVLEIDGFWSVFSGQLWVLYNMAAKPLDTNRAWFLDPLLAIGRESSLTWQTALNGLGWDLLGRVKALISDRLPGLEGIARDYGWVHQSCHNHLLRSVEHALGRYRRATPDPWLRMPIYYTLCEVLQTADEQRAQALCEQLRELIRQRNCTKLLRRLVGEFLRRYGSFRAYRQHPELHLPTTTAVMESLHSQLRRAVSTTNNPRSFRERAQAYIRLRPTCVCNGSGFTQN